jgi:hypothetical protein
VRRTSENPLKTKFAEQPFHVVDIEVERQGYGKFRFVSDGSVERIALTLRRGQADAARGPFSV